MSGVVDRSPVRKTPEPISLGLYRLATRAAAPFVPLLLRERLKRGKEDADRLGERIGKSALARPAGLLVWFHAASIGESLSILMLIEGLLDARSDLHILVTTGTLTSAKLMQERLPARAFHQFVPLDHPDYCDRFIAHWHPDLAVWVESEFWPNLIIAAHARGIPLALINARLTEKSFKGWQKVPDFIGSLLRRFSLVLAQDGASAERLRKLGALNVLQKGNLKHDAHPLHVEPEACQAIGRVIGARPVWIATNTHEGEERIALETHRELVMRYPDLLTIIIPRHPVRGAAIAEEARQLALSTARRSLQEGIASTTQVYVADTLGELGLFYSLACPVFIGGTFAPMGGHNHFEAARFGCALLAGPSDFNFAESYHHFIREGAMRQMTSPALLASSIEALLADRDQLQHCGEIALRLSRRDSGTVERVLSDLLSLLPHARQNTAQDGVTQDA
ncbi:MAG: 3-deoxy-D-manno-octulosonic acid transferase [Parvibaculum sp.]